MAKPSKIDQLPKELKNLLNKLLKGGSSIDDITKHLNEMGADVSRSGVGRHKQKIDKMRDRIKETNAITEALAENLGSDVTDNASRVTIELVRTLVMGLMTSRSGEMDVKSLKLLTESVRNLETASKLSADRELKIKEEVKKEIAEKAKQIAKDVEVKAKSDGMSDDHVEFIKEKIFGMVK